MAFSGQGAAGGAASGAAAGSVAGPWGAAIGGVAGGLLGGFSGSKKPKLNQISFSPESLKSYSFADVNLARDNPQLFEELQKNASMIAQAEQILNSRQMGMTAQEQRNMQASMGNLTARMAAQGLVGDPIAEAARIDAEQKIREQAAERAFNERRAMQGDLSAMENQRMDNIRQAQAQIMEANLANRNTSMQRDQLMAGRQADQYQQAMQGYMGQNKMYSDLLGAGLGFLGNQYNQGKTDDLMTRQFQNQKDMQNDYFNRVAGLGGSGMSGGYSPQQSYMPSGSAFSPNGWSFR